MEYNTTPNDCSCRRFLKKEICLQMIFAGLEEDLPLFETSMFLWGRLLKDTTVYEHIDDSTRNIPATLDEPKSKLLNRNLAHQITK